MRTIDKWLTWYKDKLKIEGENAPSIDFKRKIKALSLFTGIGGIDIACELCGIESVAFCDNDSFSQKFLIKRFDAYIFDEENQANNEKYIAAGKIPIFTDVRRLNKELLERAQIQIKEIELLQGGFPCQPYSVMGQRRGNDDARALYSEMLRILGEVRPRWIIGENVVGFKSLGLDGLSTDLESLRYSTTTFLYPSIAQNATHPRYRCFIVGFDKQFTKGNTKDINGKSKCNASDGSRVNSNLVETCSKRISKFESEKKGRLARDFQTTESIEGNISSNSISSGFDTTDETLSQPRWSELDKRRYNGSDIFKCSVGRICHGNAKWVSRYYKMQICALGNAVNPIQIYPLFRYIRHIDDMIFTENSLVELYDSIEKKAKEKVNNFSNEEINKIKAKFATSEGNIYIKVKCNPKICREYNPFHIESLEKNVLTCKCEKGKELWLKAQYHNIYKTNVVFADLILGKKSKGETNNYIENKPLIDAIWDELIRSGKLENDEPLANIVSNKFAINCSGNISNR